MSIIYIYLIFSMLAVIWFDATRYIIPNWLVGSLFLLYPMGVWMAPTVVDWQSALLAMVLVLAIGYIIFSLGWMGAGDIKLFAACALWVGMPNLVNFLFYVALLGGAFALVILVLRKTLPYIPMKNLSLPRLLRPGQPLPYGLAIAVGFLLMLWMGKIPAAA